MIFLRTLILRAMLVSLFGLTAQGENLTAGLESRALKPRSVATGATMFTLMVPADTGIKTENNYADPRIWAERYNEFPVGAIGTGVAIGDYDGDGLPDIFVVSKTESCRLFRNLGDWKFVDVTEKAGVGDHGDAALVWKQGATFVDVNNDGLLDIYVCRFGAPNLLYINRGDGTFREEAAQRGLAVKDASGMAAFCDYDRDGWLDVFIQTNILDSVGHPNGQHNYLFHNNGDGTFTDVTEHAGIQGEAHGHSATWWDYDNDGNPDIYVANDFSAPDVLYHNNGDGTFTNTLDAVMPCQPYHSMGADLGDVNNTGRLDLFVGEMARTTHEWDQRSIAETRTRPKDEEIARAGVPQYMRNMLYINTGTGHFLEAAQLAGIAATDWTWSARFEDLDNDGRVDLFLTNGMTREYDNVDLRSRTMLAESSLDRVKIMQSSRVEAEAHLVYRNRGDFKFEDVSARWGLNQNGVSFGAAFADLDGDGDLDLVYGNYQSGVTVLRNDSESGHRLIISLRGTRSNRFGVGATVRIETEAGPQIRTLTLARGYLSSSEPILHFGLGEQTVIKKLAVSWPSGEVQAFYNLSGDQHLTITEPQIPTSPKAQLSPEIAARVPEFVDISTEKNFSIESRERGVEESGSIAFEPFRLNRRGPALAVGDLENDGHDDIVVGGTAIDPLRVVYNSLSQPPQRADLGLVDDVAKLNDGPILIFDANGDGANDILVTKGGVTSIAGSSDFQPKLWLNDGHGHFTLAPPETLPPMPVYIGALAAADFNRDGRLGVFLGGRVKVGQYPVSPQSALWINRGEHFEDVTATLAPGLRQVGMVTSALWTDVDGDGWLDLLLTTEWGGVRYWKNLEGKGFEDRTESAGFDLAGNGLWTSLAAADFNGDGKIDYVVGNVGLNTRYRATARYPALIYRGSFSDRPGTAVIEAYYEGDKLYPWRTRRELGTKIPSVLKRFPTNDAFARATLEEILGQDKLAAAKQFTVSNLESGVFLSQADGKYVFRPLPRTAQIAPLQGMVAGDFDGDGLADIYAVQNSYAPIYSIGRFSGGLSQLLRGNGKGDFAVVTPHESGLVVPGDAKALAVIDIDNNGRPGFVLTRNNGTTMAFRNTPAPGHELFAVKLNGRSGNPTAIGARVTVELSDGQTETSEVYAGCGYESQSSATLFFGYRNNNPAQRIIIRWPSRQKTEQSLDHPIGTLRISE